MQTKALLLALAASASTSASALIPRQTVSQSIEVQHFAITANTNDQQVIYSLSAIRGDESALCQIFVNSENQADRCYNTPQINGFDEMPCANDHFSWAIKPFNGGYELQLSAIVDEEPDQANLTLCFGATDSQFVCTTSERNVFGPVDFNGTATVNTACG